jgi:RNA polymerase sigma-70 factor, ECF subfamily
MSELLRHERFLRLFLPVQRGLYGYLRTLVPNRADAEDVLQAAATVMWEKFDEFQPETPFEYWAYHIARLQALRHWKQQKRSKLVLSDSVLALLADRAVAVSNSAGELMDALELCIEQLSGQDRELLRLRFETDATNRSVARVLGRSEATISRALAHVYGRLLECMQQGADSGEQGGRP